MLSGQGSLCRMCDERLSSFFLLDLYLSENEATAEIRDEIQTISDLCASNFYKEGIQSGAARTSPSTGKETDWAYKHVTHGKVIKMQNQEHC